MPRGRADGMGRRRMLRLPDALDEELVRRAAALHTSVSALIRQAIVFFLAEVDTHGIGNGHQQDR